MGGMVSQEVVVTVPLEGRTARQIVGALHHETKYVYHLTEEVSLDNPVEVTDKPAINLVEVQSNRLLSRTLTFRVKAAAGVWQVKKTQGALPNVVYQLDSSIDGIPNESVMLNQLAQLQALRGKLVHVYSTLDPDFRGIVQDVRVSKGNKSRTTAIAEVTVREVLRGIERKARFDFQRFDPAKGTVDDPATQIISSSRTSEQVVRPLRVNTTLRETDPPVTLRRSGIEPSVYLERHLSFSPDELRRVSDGYASLSYPRKGNRTVTSLWVIDSFAPKGNTTQWALSAHFGLPYPIRFNLSYNAPAGTEPRITASLEYTRVGSSTSSAPFAGHKKHSTETRDFGPFQALVVEDIAPKGRLGSDAPARRVDFPRNQALLHGIFWLQPKHVTFYDKPFQTGFFGGPTKLPVSSLSAFYLDRPGAAAAARATPQLDRIGSDYMIAAAFAVTS